MVKKITYKVFLALILRECKYRGMGSPMLCEDHSVLRQTIHTLNSNSPKSRPMAVSLSFLFPCNNFLLYIEGDSLPFRRCMARHVWVEVGSVAA